MAFIIYEYSDYKLVLKDRVKDLKATKPKYSLLYLSQVLKIQYTFLSKVLNSSSHNLSEDQIFTLGYALEFLDDEVDYLMLLRSHQATTSQIRKDFLFRKISALQKRHNLSLNTEKSLSTSNSVDEMQFLMDSTALLVQVALSIKSFQKNPLLLASKLGVDNGRVKEILILLDRLGRIDFDANENVIRKIIQSRSHFGKDHPLTRTHQLVMKTALNQLSFSRPENKKENMFVTFTTDTTGFDRIKTQIKQFTSDVQKIALEQKHTNVYQMNLDFVEVLSTL